jgi:hypothetical protein
MIVATILATVLSGVLGAITLLHAYWGLGGVWPETNPSDLANAVVGDGRTRMPHPLVCFLVAIILAVVAAWPWLILKRHSDPIVLLGGAVIGAVFFARGLAGYSLRWRARHGAEPFATRDKFIYSPLCLAFAAGFATMLARGV